MHWNRKTAAITAALSLISFATVFAQTARAEEEWPGFDKRGCWFTPPNPPACDICADNCNPGQNCCWVFHF